MTKCPDSFKKKSSEYGRDGRLVTITPKKEPNPMGSYKFCNLEETKKEKEEMVRVTPFDKKKPSFLVKRSSVKVALCKSGCPSSRSSTMGYKHEGIYWIRVE
jgi:hypothetical protein